MIALGLTFHKLASSSTSTTTDSRFSVNETFMKNDSKEKLTAAGYLGISQNTKSLGVMPEYGTRCHAPCATVKHIS